MQEERANAVETGKDRRLRIDACSPFTRWSSSVNKRRAEFVFLLTVAASCQGSITNPDTTGSQATPDPTRPDKTNTAQPKSQECADTPVRVWKLTPAQYANTLSAFAPTTSSVQSDLSASIVKRRHMFSNPGDALDLTEPQVSQLFDVAKRVTENAPLSKLASCLTSTPGDESCLKELAKQAIDTAWRRDATEADTQALAAWAKALPTSITGMSAAKLMFQRILLSPEALFRTELGGKSTGPSVTLTADERASALSFFLTDGPPDSQLRAAARSKELESAEGMRRHAMRLAQGSSVALGIKKLVAELYLLHEASALRKDPAMFPEFTPALGSALTEQSDRFVDQILWNGQGTFTDLMTSSFAESNAVLSKVYGGGVTAGGWSKVDQASGRRGVLSLPALMATLARQNDTDPVARGKFIRERVLCQSIPNPPNNVVLAPRPANGSQTQRERLAAHTVGDCAVCHSAMDPLGLAFETFDTLGRSRTMDVGKPIDITGKLTGVGDKDQTFNDSVELATLIAKSSEAQDCFVQKTFAYAYGREVEASDECNLKPLQAAFAKSGGNILDLMVQVATNPGFVTRRAQ